MVWTYCGSASSSIGGLILDDLVQHWRRGLILDGLNQHRTFPVSDYSIIDGLEAAFWMTLSSIGGLLASFWTASSSIGNFVNEKQKRAKKKGIYLDKEMSHLNFPLIEYSNLIGC